MAFYDDDLLDSLFCFYDNHVPHGVGCHKHNIIMTSAFHKI